MVVVLLTAGGALLALKAYNGLKSSNPARLETVLFSIKQQAGVMAAICTAVFGVISALQSARMIGGGSSGTEHVPSLTGIKFGARGSERAALPA